MGVDTYDVDAAIHVTSAFVIFSSLAAKLDMTVTPPVKNDVMATANVHDNRHKHSCRVDVKASGRAFGSLIGCCGVVMTVPPTSDLASTSAASVPITTD